MNTEDLAKLHLIAIQFHLLICSKPGCPRCKAALLAREAVADVQALRPTGS